MGTVLDERALVQLTSVRADGDLRAIDVERVLLDGIGGEKKVPGTHRVAQPLGAISCAPALISD